MPVTGKVIEVAVPTGGVHIAPPVAVHETALGLPVNSVIVQPSQV